MKTDIGYYSAAGKNFSSKIEAVMHAQKTLADVSWHFHDEVFSKVDWTTEPETSIDEFYRIRAQQIRDEYDYVVVFCSGGADSSNVIRTFINNKIHVDEVVGIAPMEGLKNWKFDKTNIAESNTISEAKFALLPLLDEVSRAGIKTTLYDFFEEMMNKKDEEWTVDGAGNIVTALTPHFTNFESIPTIQKQVEAGKKVALVYGTDKPVIKFGPRGDKMFVLTDGGINYLNMPSHRERPNVDRVLFYWTPELPEMLVKQCHIVDRALQLPHMQFVLENEVKATPQKIKQITGTFEGSKDDIISSFFDGKGNYSYTNKLDSTRTMYQRMIVPYIYPSTYEPDLFQVQKVNINQGFFTRDQDWVHILHKGSRVSEMLLAGTKEMYKSINPKYLNAQGTGFIPLQKMYRFGTKA